MNQVASRCSGLICSVPQMQSLLTAADGAAPAVAASSGRPAAEKRVLSMAAVLTVTAPWCQDYATSGQGGQLCNSMPPDSNLIRFTTEPQLTIWSALICNTAPTVHMGSSHCNSTS